MAGFLTLSNLKSCLIGLLLAACSSSSPPLPANTPIAGWPNPAPGQWASGLYAQVVTPNLGTSFAIPNGNGLHYVYTVAPANLKTASTMTLTFTVSGNAVFGINDPTDGPPAQVDLFIWQGGDNLTCAGAFEYYRQFSNQRALLQNGTYTLSVQLNQAAWHDCYGHPLGLSQAINGAVYVGFTFGGANFDGHGVYVQSGNATFTINSFAIQ